MKNVLITVILNLGLAVSNLQAAPLSTGLYMGQEPPDLTPEIFAPGLISLDKRYEQSITFSPDGNECYFTVRTVNWSNSWVMQTFYQNGAWTTPQRTSFSNTSSLSASLSHDDSRLLFSSNRGTGQGIWQCFRTGEHEWSNPVEMDRQVSSTADEWSCHISDLGNVFVCSWRPGGRGRCDGWRIPCINGQYLSAENLTIMNSSGDDCGVTPGPQERYVIFQSNRSGGYGLMDLYLSFAKSEGGWTEPRNLGPAINSSSIEAAPWISRDGRYLFFSSTRGKTADIYWVQTSAFLPDPNSSITNLVSGQPIIEDSIMRDTSTH